MNIKLICRFISWGQSSSHLLDLFVVVLIGLGHQRPEYKPPIADIVLIGLLDNLHPVLHEVLVLEVQIRHQELKDLLLKVLYLELVVLVLVYEHY